MSLLKSEPKSAIQSLPQLLAIAHAMEEESVRRYGQLARRMQELDNEPARKVFEDLVEEERGHSAAVKGWSEDRLGRQPDPVDVRWEGWKETFEEEDLGHSRLVTPYRALSVAVRNEERAFAFWSYISAHAHQPEIRLEAERLAVEELDHVRKLRAARRRAYHEEQTPPVSELQRLRSATPDELCREAARLEAGLAILHRKIAEALARQDHPAAGTLDRVAQEEEANAKRLAPTDAPHEEGGGDGLPGSGGPLLDLAIERIEAAVDLYFLAAEESPDEATMVQAQRLAEAAIKRLDLIREQSENFERTR